MYLTTFVITHGAPGWSESDSHDLETEDEPTQEEIDVFQEKMRRKYSNVRRWVYYSKKLLDLSEDEGHRE
jgi:hypothetical protein